MPLHKLHALRRKVCTDKEGGDLGSYEAQWQVNCEQNFSAADENTQTFAAAVTLRDRPNHALFRASNAPAFAQNLTLV